MFSAADPVPGLVRAGTAEVTNARRSTRVMSTSSPGVVDAVVSDHHHRLLGAREEAERCPNHRHPPAGELGTGCAESRKRDAGCGRDTDAHHPYRPSLRYALAL